ncbi:MFS transporter [uncultured Lactobacillus sp.]|uniref:MFS transporter n=1 Tax=uncultured Lactobacillus sp. TaxID=153152 RepID=UPI00259BEEA7|nr:MFS transporter [uncultured Lactobacillus sp.]
MQSNRQRIMPWLVMFAIGLVSAACLGSSMVLMGSFLPAIGQTLHVPISVVSYYYTVMVLVMAVMMPIVPKVLVKVRNNFLYLTIAVIMPIGLMLIGHVSNLWIFFIIAFIFGICVSFLSFVPVGILMDNWFVKKTNFAIGLCWAITSIFQGIMSPILGSLIPNIGWQHTLNILAIVVAVLSIPFSLFIRFTPKTEGLQPYGFKNEQEKHQESSNREDNISTHEIVTSATFWIVMLLLCIFQFPAVLNQMFPTYAASVGFNGATGGLMVTAAMIFDIFLNPLIGGTDDKLGAEKGSILWLTIGLVSYVLLIVATNMKSAGLAIFSAGINDVVYVFLGTGITALASAMFGKKAFAKGFSLVSSISFVVGAFAMPLNNFIAEKFGGFTTVYIFFAILIAITIVLIGIGSKRHFIKD